MKLNKIKNEKGFTLIELIIALSIISIVSMAFFRTINSSIKYNTKNEKDIKALNVAQTEIENIRNEIKKSKTDIIINDEIIIPSDNIVWIEKEVIVEGQTEKVTKEFVQIDDDPNKNTLQYNKTIPGEITEYIVKLDLSREKKADKSSALKYLYTINIEVKAENENLSNKTTILTTSVLSK